LSIRSALHRDWSSWIVTGDQQIISLSVLLLLLLLWTACFHHQSQPALQCIINELNSLQRIHSINNFRLCYQWLSKYFSKSRFVLIQLNNPLHTRLQLFEQISTSPFKQFLLGRIHTLFERRPVKHEWSWLRHPWIIKLHLLNDSSIDVTMYN
jgi:hypothetical protein